jgi:hypothetical protein
LPLTAKIKGHYSASPRGQAAAGVGIMVAMGLFTCDFEEGGGRAA